jgi:hypothetical protein
MAPVRFIDANEQKGKKLTALLAIVNVSKKLNKIVT